MSKKLPKSVQFIKGVGPKWAKVLSKLNIYSITDLFYYFPRDYEDRSEISTISQVKPGQSFTLKVKVVNKEFKNPRKGLYILKITFVDETGTIIANWFNQSYLKKQLKKDKWYYLNGEIDEKNWNYNNISMNNPVFEVVKKNTIHTNRIVPIYPLTNGLTQNRLRKIIYYALKDYAIHLNNTLPLNIRKKYRFSSLEKSLWGLHFPDNRKHYIKAHKRLAFEELFLLQLLVLERKQGTISEKGITHSDPGQILINFLDSLEFELTTAQQQAWEDIKIDMETDIPMQRLLQGDVGSGKTIIAVLALIETMSNGFQGIFMAPTEILAEQHYLTISDLLQPLGFKVTLLVGSLKKSQREEIEKSISNNEIDLIIGTHALFQEGIQYKKVGLVVIDEQHRFGVEQRYSLKNKGDNPDLLVMTATPIPRSLALTLYGDLDLTLIDELPPGRKPVITTWRKRNVRDKIYVFMKDKLKKGRQAFVVCPLIEPSEEINAVSAEIIKEELENTILCEFKIELLHSQIDSERKKIIMNKFRDGEIDVLVSTTVIEVGVDVSNASLMVVEDAERFGLAQLHQLRGRVGRGQYQSYCIAIANPTTEEAYKRLKVFTNTNDGFDIAEADLEIRGPGEFFGTKQHGLPDLKVANIIKDKKLLTYARKEAKSLIQINDWKNIYDKLFEKVENLELKV